MLNGAVVVPIYYRCRGLQTVCNYFSECISTATGFLRQNRLTGCSLSSADNLDTRAFGSRGPSQ